MGFNLFKRSGHTEEKRGFVPTEGEQKLINDLRVNQMDFREAQDLIGGKVEDPLRRDQVWGLVRDQRAKDSTTLEANRPGVERL